MYLLKRAIDGQVSDLKRLLGLGEASVEARDAATGLAPLHYAAWYNRADAVDTLLQYGAAADVPDKTGATPLHYAARYKTRFTGDGSDSTEQKRRSRRVIQALLGAHAAVNARDVYGVTPLFFAVLRGNEEAAAELLSRHDTDVNSADHRLWTTLHVAAKYDRVDILRLLLEQEQAGAQVAELRAKTDKGFTPMHVAAIEGNVGVMAVLVDAYRRRSQRGDEKVVVDVAPLLNDETVDGESPLDLAIENRETAAVTFCIQNGANVRKTCRAVSSSTLHLAAAAGDAGICRLLLDKDAKLVHMRNAARATPLHRAAAMDRAECAALLIDRGSDMEAMDEDRMTPLLTAVQSGSMACVKLLLSRGANLLALSKDDQSAIHLAAATDNRLGILQLITDKMSSAGVLSRMVSADDRIGDSPLHLAARRGHLDVLRHLLGLGADIHNKNEEEEIALHVAADTGHTPCVVAMLDSTLDPTIINASDEDSNTPLHLAAARGHLGAVRALVEHGADLAHRNRLFWSPLACAADGGHLAVVDALLGAGADIAAEDRHKCTPLHLAAIRGHDKVAAALLARRAPLSVTNTFGNNPLDTAVKYGNKKVAMAIVLSENWEEALKNRTPGPRRGDPYETPLRKLIRKMPDVAEKVFDRCITYPKGKDVKDSDLQITFNFEYVDDTYTCACWGDPALVGVQNASGKVYDEDGHVLPEAAPYTTNGITRESNHPLSVMVSQKRGELLYHPLILSLVKHKWRLAQFSYFSFLAFFILFVTVFTNIMVMSKPPFMYDESVLSALISNSSNASCGADLSEADLAPAHASINQDWLAAARVIVWVMCALGILIEVEQLWSTPRSYLMSFTNTMDVFIYVAAAVVLLPLRPCDLWTPWQWQLGTLTMFVAWMDLILFLRRLPGVGIYIVMVGEVFVTFLRFFLFCFSLFIFAFGFTFYSLLRNQEPFASTGYSFGKTLVMMIGEIDYGDIFHGEDEEESAAVHYKTLTFLTFITFLCMVTIVIMNLLTGLAVGDVQEIQDHAKLKKLAMQVNLALDVELSLPESLRKRLHCCIRRTTLAPNRMVSRVAGAYNAFMNGPLASRAIADAIFTEVEEQLEEDAETEDRRQQQRLEEFQQNMAVATTRSRENMDLLHVKVDTLQAKINMLLQRLTPEEGQDTGHEELGDDVGFQMRRMSGEEGE